MSRVAALVVTNRPRFLPWWKHQIEKQTRQPNEIIVVDNRSDLTAPWIANSRQGPLGGGWFAKHCDPKTTLGELRQVALDMATADIVLWFDDDDWYHPRRIELLAAPIEAGIADAAVMPITHLLYLETMTMYPMFGGVGLHLPATAWRRSSVRHIPFLARNIGEDDAWARGVMGVPPKGDPDGERPPAAIGYDRVKWIMDYQIPSVSTMVLVHGNNTYQRTRPSDSRMAVSCGTPLYSYPPKDVSSEEWSETLRLLEQLRQGAKERVS